jgi:hypothetical protein
MSELKPCPFCGKEVSIVTDEWDWPWGFCFKVSCSNDLCTTADPYERVTKDEEQNENNKQILIEKWNTRA